MAQRITEVLKGRLGLDARRASGSQPDATLTALSTYGGGVSTTQMIDWQVATSTGVRWVRPGPQVSMAEARKVGAGPRQLADPVAEPVRELTGLPGSPDDGRVAVVDRPGWIRANVDGFRVVLDPLVQKMADSGSVPQAGSVVTAVG